MICISDYIGLDTSPFLDSSLSLSVLSRVCLLRSLSRVSLPALLFILYIVCSES